MNRYYWYRLEKESCKLGRKILDTYEFVRCDSKATKKQLDDLNELFQKVFDMEMRATLRI